MRERAIDGPSLRSLVLLLGSLALSGCSFLSSPDREFRENDRVLDTLAASLGYSIDRDEFELTRAEIEDDAATLHYRGVEYPGDQAWVVRFSEKSTELSPEALTHVESAVAVIREEGLQPSFSVSGTETVVIDGLTVELARYTFKSHLAPAERTGLGILAATRAEVGGLPIVVQIKLDNYGDRQALAADALRPFLAPLKSRAE